MEQVLRWIGALAVATLSPAVAVTACVLMFDPYKTSALAVWWFVSTLVVAGLHVVLIGFPALLWLRSRSAFHLRPLLVAGFTVGALPVLAVVSAPLFLDALRGREVSLLPAVLATLALGGCGLMGSASLYLVCRVWKLLTLDAANRGPAECG